MMRIPSHKDPEKRAVTVYLRVEEFEALAALCEARGQTRSDFLRAAIEVADRVPIINTRPLSGACLELHKAKVRREKRAKGTKT
jgi:hypothetical protein